MKSLEKFKEYIIIHDQFEFNHALANYIICYKEPPVVHIYYLGKTFDNLFLVEFSDNIFPKSGGVPRGFFTRRELYKILIDIKHNLNVIVYGTLTNKAVVYEDTEIDTLIKKISRGMRA